MYFVFSLVLVAIYCVFNYFCAKPDPEKGWKMEYEAHFFMLGGCKVVESGVKWFHQNSIGALYSDVKKGALENRIKGRKASDRNA